MNLTCAECEDVTEQMSVYSKFVVTMEMIFMVIICGGNLLTIRAVWMFKKLQTIPNHHIVSLACADLLAGLMLPYQAALKFPGVQVVFDRDKYLCLCRHVVLYVSLGQTIVSITVIAVDRALFIGFPLRYQAIVTVFKTRVLIAGTWIFAIILGTVPMYYNNWYPGVRCSYFLVIPFYYQSLIQTTTFVLFSLINAFCYGYIFMVARKQQRRINQQLAATKTAQNSTNLKAVKMFLTVFGVFFVCMSPGIVAMNLGHTIGLRKGVIDTTILLALLNSGMNVFIYAVKNKDFNHAFRTMTGIGRRQSVTPTQLPQTIQESEHRNDTRISTEF